MRALIFLTVFAALIFTTVSGAAEAVNFNPNWKSQPSAPVITGQTSMFYYEGVDTLCAAALEDSSWGNDTLSTDWMQVQWGSNYSTTLPPNYALSDSITAHNPQLFDLWVKLDTLTTSYTCSTAINDADSSNLLKIIFECKLSDNDICTWADSSDQFINFDNYTHPFYGLWRWLPPIESAAPTGQWVVYPVRLPVCEAARFKFYAADDILEQAIVNWRLVCKN